LLQFRITKYDPAYRDGRGAYLREEWTSSAHIGRSFEGVVLTEAEYRRVEDAYVASALAFLKEAGVTELTVLGLENPRAVELPFSEGSALDLEVIGEVLRRVLREEFWCRLEGPESFLHVDWDYYLFVGVPVACPAAEALAQRLELFVEPCLSPCLEEGPAEAEALPPGDTAPDSSP
jgi:hypothetical protein